MRSSTPGQETDESDDGGGKAGRDPHQTRAAQRKDPPIWSEACYFIFQQNSFSTNIFRDFYSQDFFKKNLLVIYDVCESKLTSKFWKMFSNEADDDEGAQTPSEKSLEPKESVHSSLLRLHFPNDANRK